MSPSSFQRSFLPVPISDLYPSNQNSADLAYIGTGIDGRDYAVKRVSDGRGFVPASELFCYELAAKLHIPTPEYRILGLRGGELAFGSIWEGGVQAPITKVSEMMDILTGKKPVKELKKFLSKVFAFDLFINNEDRHIGNYLFRGSFQGIIGLAYDFSRAWYEIGYQNFNCIQHTSNTYSYHHKYIRQSAFYDQTIAQQTLNLISQIPPSEINDILFSCMPHDWLPIPEKQDVVSWWTSSSLNARITTLMAEV